ncbi:MAG: M20 family metallo-hydrolase [Candidatus Korarchaeota archaeon]|nr:M20 family metallo-hydrolase [Candidatus Korarchaeota archaeon]
MGISSIEAIGPENGGEGELEKAKYIESILRDIGIPKIERFDARDDRVPSGIRPNLIAKIPGKADRTLWIVSHMDVVPPGDLSQWGTDPFKPVVKDGKIYGRGTEDDGQGIFSSVFAAKAIIDEGIEPNLSLGLAIVSDEETGNRYGIEHLISQGLFGEDDLVVVPDAGNSDGTMIEVAEKGILWLRVTVRGRQTHASTPNRGLNAHRIGMELALQLDRVLHAVFGEFDPIFDPPASTFEPTKREPNVENVNTIPGRDVFYFDCRVLPRYDLDEVIRLARDVAKAFESAYGTQIDVEAVARMDAAPPTDSDAEVVRRLMRAIKLAGGVEAKPMGIGGGTCAAAFRAAGLQAAVWMTTDETAHQPNEYCRIDNLVGDAKVFALLPILEAEP